MEDCLIAATPVRIIPFDLGCQLNSYMQKMIIDYLKTTFRVIKRDSKFTELNPDCFVSAEILDGCYVDFFNSGIVIFSIYEGEITFDNPDYFSIEYNESRRSSHRLLFDWKHNCSNSIKKTLKELRRLISNYNKNIRPSASFDFESNGISYIMTVSFFKYIDPNNQYDYDSYPNWLKKNIVALLDPSLLYLEESSSNHPDIKSDYKCNCMVIDSLSDYHVDNYDSRRNISAHMSWSAVVIVGELNETNISDYVYAEIKLQHEWFLAHCIINTLPSNVEDARIKKISIQMIQSSITELDLLSDRLFSTDHSRIPTRFMRINKGLVETSGIEAILSREIKRLNHIADSLSIDIIERQRKYASGSEILLLVIAIFQIVPIVLSFTSPENIWIGAIIIFAIVILGTLLLFRKNRVMFK